MYAITTYFNPCRYASRKQNYEIFSRHLAAQGIPLITVEVLFGNSQSELTGRAEVITRRTDSLLWHKEAALNIAVSLVPQDEKYIAWLDCDVVFPDDRWVSESERAIEDGFELVQPFDTVCRLPKIEFGEATAATNEIKRSRGFAAGLNYLGYSDYPQTLQLYYGDTGFAWVARAGLLRKHGLYAGNIIGGGDLTICHAALASYHKYFLQEFFNLSQRCHIMAWAIGFYKDVKKRIAHVAGPVFHLNHGSIKHRGYNVRHEALLRYDFDPYSDIVMMPSGLYGWSSDKPGMHRQVASYFSSRREDD